MSEEILYEIDPDGTRLTCRGPAGVTELPLRRLVPGIHLLEHLGTRLLGAERTAETLILTLSDGARVEVDPRKLAPARPPEPGARPPADLILRGIGRLATMDPGGDAASGRGASLPGEDPLGTIPDAALAAWGGRVVALGPEADVLSNVRPEADAREVDVGGRLVTPGLVDPHTHPVFAGDRSQEFALRARGASYQEIAAAGGGIRATVDATRAASAGELERLAAARLADLLRHGVTTAEAKSGYDLTLEGELRLLRVIRRLDHLLPLSLSPTLLGAHVVPPEYADHRSDYVALVADRMVPRAASEGLAESVDVFCDAGAFTVEESRRVLEAARAHGLARRIHAEQFVDLGATGLAAGLGAASADHLEAVSEADLRAMHEASTVAVLLPGAALTLSCPWPPVSRLREAGVPIALGTDLNPGTSMTTHLPLMMSIACMQMGMTVEEAWLGVTRTAARAALRPEAGRLAVGGAADLVIFECDHPAAVPYQLGARLTHAVYKAGMLAWQRTLAP